LLNWQAAVSSPSDENDLFQKASVLGADVEIEDTVATVLRIAGQDIEEVIPRCTRRSLFAEVDLLFLDSKDDVRSLHCSGTAVLQLKLLVLRDAFVRTLNS